MPLAQNGLLGHLDDTTLANISVSAVNMISSTWCLAPRHESSQKTSPKYKALHKC